MSRWAEMSVLRFVGFGGEISKTKLENDHRDLGAYYTILF
jgi:hypothetical protein